MNITIAKTAMAIKKKSKKKNLYTRIYSTSGTGEYYYIRKPKELTKDAKIERNKYDKKVRKHVVFSNKQKVGKAAKISKRKAAQNASATKKATNKSN